jgi:hypothetical protein
MASTSLYPNGGTRSLQPPFSTNNRRDNPLFPLRRGPEQLDFFTDSLEFSQIPSPSPPKAGAAIAKPRRATRNLRAGISPEKEGRSGSSSSSDTRHPDDNLKPSPLLSQRRSFIPTRSGRSTPSPARGRPLHPSLQSPASDSSPPRGLAEAYQRIDEEENLTAQEGELEGEPGYDEDQEMPDDTFEQASIDRARLERVRSSASSNSRSPSLIPRRSSSRIDLMASTENKENHHQDDTQGTETAASGLSFLDDVTDDSLRKKLHAHAMDESRLARATKSQSPAFGRSTRTPKLTAKSLQRHRDDYGDPAQTNGTPTGSVSERSDIPLNVPKNWGSNGKVSNDWLSRINTRKALNSPTPQSYRGSPVSGIDWTAAAADVPIPSVENSSSPLQPSSQGSTPTGSARKNPSLDKVREWEFDADFTARSLQASNSPPIRLRSNALDEIEDLEKKAVTTNRLGEIHKRSSDEFLRKRSPTPMLEPDAPLARKTSRSRLIKTVDQDDISLGFEENLPIKKPESEIPDTPVVILKSPANDDVKDRSQSSNGSNLTIKGEDARPSERDLHDSQELLRQLARASSASPMPAAENWTLVDEEGNSQNSQNQELAKDEKEKEREVEDASHLPDITPAVKKQELSSKTPVVTGAWIETPMPTARRRNIPSTRHPEEPIPEELTNGIEETVKRPKSQRPSETSPVKLKDDVVSIPHPSLPKSALAAVVAGVKSRKSTRQNDSLMITEDTIDSLESLLGLSDEEMSTLLKFPNMNMKFPTTFDFNLDPSLTNAGDIPDTRSKAEREREHISKMAQYSRSINRLQLLRHSIHDVKNGISKLEHQVSTTDPHHASQLRCIDCGCESSSALVLYTPQTHSTANALYIPFFVPAPRLWRKVPNRKFRTPTRLGYVLLAITIWLVTEAYLAHWYSPHYTRNPFPAPDYPIRWDAPVYPYVTVTKLYEWSGVRDISSLVRPIWRLVRILVIASVRLVAQMVGWGDGFVDEGGRGGGGGNGVPVSVDERIPKPEYAPDFSMMGDEYL